MPMQGCQWESCCDPAEVEIFIPVRFGRTSTREPVALCTVHRREYRVVVDSRSADRSVRIITQDCKYILTLDGAGQCSREPLQEQ